jgi:hypothetical protein
MPGRHAGSLDRHPALGVEVAQQALQFAIEERARE